MKKILIAIVLLLVCCSFASAEIVYVSHYENYIGDEIQAAVSPIDGNLYVVINNSISLVFVAAAIDEFGIHWHNDFFGDMVFSIDCKSVMVYENSSRQVFNFYYTRSHTEILY